MYFCIHAGILGLIAFFLGPTALLYQMFYSCAALWYLEVINYIEHYGLQRDTDENGIVESISKMHSWNSHSNTLLFRIQRHSDHHAHSFRPY